MRDIQTKRSKDAMKINSLVFTLNEIMFPHYVSLIDITVLLLVSKRLKRLMDAQKSIVQYTCKRGVQMCPLSSHETRCVPLELSKPDVSPWN